MSALRKYGQSLLDQPIGIDESRQRQLKDAEVRGTAHDIKLQQRLGRRAYRGAMKAGKYGAAMDALDWVMGRTGATGSGIQAAGGLSDALEQRQNNRDGLFSQNRQMQNPASTSAPEQTGPPAPPRDDSPLGKRLSLFDRIKSTMAEGGDVQALAPEAVKLGIDRAGFTRGLNKAFSEQPNTTPLNTNGVESGSIPAPAGGSRFDFQELTQAPAGFTVPETPNPQPIGATSDLFRLGKDWQDLSSMTRNASTQAGVLPEVSPGAPSGPSPGRFDAINRRLSDALAKNNDAYSVQKKLQSDYFGKVLRRSEADARVTGTIGRAFRDTPEAFPKQIAPMDYEGFDKSKYPAANSPATQKKIDDDQNKRLDALRSHYGLMTGGGRFSFPQAPAQPSPASQVAAPSTGYNGRLNVRFGETPHAAAQNAANAAAAKRADEAEKALPEWLRGTLAGKALKHLY